MPLPFLFAIAGTVNDPLGAGDGVELFNQDVIELSARMLTLDVVAPIHRGYITNFGDPLHIRAIRIAGTKARADFVGAA